MPVRLAPTAKDRGRRKYVRRQSGIIRQRIEDNAFHLRRVTVEAAVPAAISSFSQATRLPLQTRSCKNFRGKC